MSKQTSGANEQISSSRMSDTADYSAHIQEAMRYNKLRPSEYHIAMTIMHAISHGLNEEKWENEQQGAVKMLTNDGSSPYNHVADSFPSLRQLYRLINLFQ